MQRGPAPGDQIFLSARDAAPPTITTLNVPAQAGTGTRVGLSARATDTQSPVSLEWQFGDGSSAVGTGATHAYGAAGTYTVTLTARDGAANATNATRTITVRTIRDTTPPRITSLTVTNRRFRAGSAGTVEIARAHRTPTGTAFHLRVDERATIVIALTRTVVSHHRRLIASPGTVVRSGRGPGAVAIGFSGRLGSVRLNRGTYTATVTAVDAAGNRSRAARVRFEVVAR